MSFLMLLVLLLAPLLAGPAVAVTSPGDMLPDPVLEDRARNLGREIRCMVCQNQSIEDSEVGLARDLRLLVRERISAGDSDREVKSFLHARYGDFVLLRPPFAWNTLILWATPLVALLVGFGLILLARRGSASTPAPAPLNAEEQRRLAEIEAALRGPAMAGPLRPKKDGTKA
ncbi:cytochrome c-type biogenesis protein [Falsiroseomonas sp.]|uniref:cytochrome c-type biogenesis protein n=1 Tax=Falsiroseomonas sp. TaxID=2870721 RepID=UPI00273615D2|nr:cytochrome c-type biogenesis protein [Falsiroseomonas sp.]MDP3415796.1 cytochrome c-type biogenesis protein CcmH [Falsiroseomonas sp.]